MLTAAHATFSQYSDVTAPHTYAHRMPKQRRRSKKTPTRPRMASSEISALYRGMPTEQAPNAIPVVKRPRMRRLTWRTEGVKDMWLVLVDLEDRMG
jgi:hypothetical protein